MASLIFERISSSSSSSSSSSYSSSTHGRKYDVFLSFSGEEPRHGFTDHLYEELRRKRIHVCRDDEKLQGGEVVALELMKAIEESQYAIVVLSEKFADSKRCLDELAKIVECREKRGLSIFPVFDHVDPSDVHNQKGPFETVFAKHETDDSVTIEKKQKWMDALRDVSNISGWCLHDRSESTVIQNIVERMHSELHGEFESVSKDLVGMESSIEGVIDLLDKGSDDVRFIGIWGCGGVGKTTLAQVIYCKISNQFDTKSFICFGSVGQTKNDYLVPIQKLLLSNIFAEREVNITSVHEGKKVIKQMLCSRKVLIVLDNVNDKGQLDAIAGSRDWFGVGSRLIITSRDKQLLTSYNVDMYEAKTLDNDKALELFSRKAFRQPHPKKDFVDFSNDFVKYAQGLPLFLEVFGSSLHKEGIEVWKIFLDQLNENSSGEIMERLEISYKRILDQKAKELFLDIVFFFKGMDKNRVANILNDPSYWQNIDILKKKSLITILGRKVWMHDLLQEMGREIVRREAPQEPGLRSRLWHHKDIFSILQNNTGTKHVEGMMLNCPPNKEDLNANCFSEMTRLRLINICNVLLPHGLNYLSNELQMMEWNDYPLKFMPRNFRPNNLVELIMHHSHIEQLPEGFTNLDQLKLMDFSYSQNLIKTPDFIGFQNLEMLIFQGCTRLYKVQPSVVALRWLTLLNLKDCKHLKSLPYEIDLESLEIFILSGCSRLKKFSEIGRNMTRLSELYLDGTAIEELPPSIKHLTGLTLLNLKDCNDLLSFPSVICSLTSLEILTLSGCRGRPRKPLHLLGLSPMASSIGVNLTFKGTILLLIMSFLVLPYNYLSIFVCATLIIWTYCFLSARYPEPEPINLLLPKSFSGLSSLKSLDLSDCNLSDGALPEDLSCLFSLRFLNLSKNNFTFLPDSISQLSKLKLLCLDNCSNLQSLPYLPSSTNFVMARGCSSLENYSKKVVVWTSGEIGFTFINCLSLVEEEDKITEVSLLGSLLEDEGSKRTEVSLLDIHFQPLWQRYMEGQIRESEGFCCVLPQSEITEWFKNQNCGSYVLIPLHRYSISLRGIALCVDFEVHKNSNEVSPRQDAKFICRLYIDGAPRDPIVYTVPRDKICVGSFGIWLYISHKRIREVDQCDCIRPLIRTNSADIEIKGCGARILYEPDVVEFVQHLSQNIFGSLDDLRRSEDFIKCHLGNSQSRDDKVESSQSNVLFEPSPRLRSALWSLLSRLYEGDHARHHYYDYIFPQIAIPRDWFSYQNLESYIKLELPPNLQDNSTWMGFTIFASYTVDKQRAGWSYGQNPTIFLHFYSFSASEEVPLAPYIAFPLTRDVFDESSRRLLVFYIPRAWFQLNCFSHIWASFGNDNQVVKVEMCGIRIVYEQDVEQFVQTLVQCMLEIPVAYHRSLYQNLLHQLALLHNCNHERGFCSSFLSERRPQTMPKLLPTYEIVAEEYCTSPENQDIIHQNSDLLVFSNSTEIPEWFSYQNLWSSIRTPLPLDLHDDSSWIGIVLFAIVVVHKNLKSQDYKVFIKFNCRSDMIEGPVDRCPLVLDITEFVPEPLPHAGSFSLTILVRAGQLRDHIKECSWISALITSDSPYVMIRMYGALVLYKQDVVKFIQAEGKIKQRSKCQINKVESSQSNDRLKGKLMSLLLRVYQGDLARNHKYDYIFPHMSVPDWFSNRSFCSDIRIRLPINLQCNERWMGIAVCAYYTVQKRPAISGDNKDLTSFLNFYNTLVSHRVCLTRHRVFQESKDIFVESSHRIVVFYIPHVLLRLEKCRHIGASFEHNKPDVRVKECGLRLVYEQDVEKFVQTLAECMLESPDAYHECFYQNLLHQVEEREASKVFGFSSKLQRMPQPMPILQPSIENIAEGCTSSETSPSSFTGFLATARKEQYASIMSSESLIKARLEKNFDEGEIFNCCFAEREIPLWFCYENKQTMKIPLVPEFVNDPDWMGFALCGLFSYNKHPTAVRQNLGSMRIESLQFRCLLRTSSCYRRLVCHGLLTTDNELVTLNQRAFIWVMFIPRTTLAHLWSKSASAEFQLESSIPDLLAESFGISLVFRHNMEELTQLLVQCSAPFDSLLDSCDPRVFYNIWENHPELFIGTKNYYDDLHPQRLFISQEETSATAQYSDEEYLYPDNHFRCFHPSTLYNSCFPTRRTPRWFDHHCCLGHSVTIEIPPNLYEDNNWLGLALYASILIPRDRENAVSANSSHFLYCQFQTSKASLDNQILVCRTTDEEENWLDLLFGLIWISYIPGEALKDMLHQRGHIKASFVSDWPSVMVQKCGLRLLYQHDRLQFEQQLKHCNAFISAHRDLKCQMTSHGTKLESMERFDGHYKYSYCFTPVEILDYFNYRSNEPSVKIDLSNVFLFNFSLSLIKHNISDLQGFDRSCDYNSCCPPIEIPHWFHIQSDESHVRFRLTRNLHNSSTWIGVALCAVFSIDKVMANLNDVVDSKSSYKLICHLKASNGLSVKPRHIYWPTKEDLMMSLLGGFTWLTYIPRGSFPDWLYDCASIKFSFKTNCLGLKVQKCGLRLLYQNSESDISAILNQKRIENRNKKMRSLIRNELGKNDPLGFDRCIFYNPCLPSSEILEWFDHRSDEPWLTIALPPNLYNDSTWMGLVLCAYFAIDVKTTAHFDIPDSDTNYDLIYHLETNVGSVRPLDGYSLTKEDLVMLQESGCILLSYIERGSFQNYPNQVTSIMASFGTDCPGLKVEKCGLRLLYHYDLEEYDHSMNSSSDDGEGTSSRTSSARKESNFGSQRGPIDPKDKGKRVLEE